MQRLLTLISALALTLAAAAPAAAQVIDTFDGAYDAQTVYFSSGPPVQTQFELTVAAAVPGGSRRLQLVADTTATGTSSASLSGSGDLWAFAGGGQRTALNFAYGTQTAMDLDLSAAGALHLDVYLSTPMKLVVYASTQTTSGGNPNASAVSLDLPDLFRQSVDIPLSAFGTNSATGLPVAWADVDTLAFFVSANGAMPASGDTFWIEQLSAVPVPEPASTWLLAAGLSALLGRRIRARRLPGLVRSK